MTPDRTPTPSTNDHPVMEGHTLDAVIVAAMLCVIVALLWGVL